MQRFIYRWFTIVSIAATFGIPASAVSQTQARATDQGRAELEEYLYPGWTPRIYGELLRDLGYDIITADTGGTDYAQYEVAKGGQRYLIQMEVNPNSRRVQDVNIIKPSNVAANKAERRVPIVEEQVNIDTRRKRQGGVRVETGVKEVPVEKSVELREQDVDVYRRPANRPATDVDEAFDRDVIVIPEYAEVPVIKKERRVVGEVVIDRDVAERQQQVQATKRRTTVDVDELEPTELEQQAAVEDEVSEPQQRSQTQRRQQSQAQQRQQSRAAQ